MVKVTITPEKVAVEGTPSAQIIAAAKKSIDVTDALGRVITLKKPGPLEKLDFAKAAGGAEINQLYLAEVMHLQYVKGIDGDPVISPANEGELRALYARLGEEGNEAAQLGIYEHFMPNKPGVGEESLKNS